MDPLPPPFRHPSKSKHGLNGPPISSLDPGQSVTCVQSSHGLNWVGMGGGSRAGWVEEEKEPHEDDGEGEAENCKQTCTLFSAPLISHKQDSSLVVISHKRLPHSAFLFHSPCLSSAYLPHQINNIRKYIKCFSDQVSAHLSRKREEVARQLVRCVRLV